MILILFQQINLIIIDYIHLVLTSNTTFLKSKHLLLLFFFFVYFIIQTIFHASASCTMAHLQFIFNLGMGQNQAQTQQLFPQWQQSLHEPNLYFNSKTGELAECQIVNLRRSEQVIMRKRTQQNHKNICRILHYEPAQKFKAVKEETKFLVYIQKLFTLSQSAWVPVNSVLAILKGFRRLTSSYGTFRISHGMIKVNNAKQIKVWINESPIKNEIIASTENQTQMILDISSIVSEYDSKLGLALNSTFSFNEAINLILHSMTTPNVNHSYIASKVIKNQQRPHFLVCSPSTASKNHFRSTKETEDNQIKPIIQNQFSKEPVQNIDIKMQNSFLANVHVPKNPVYVDVSGFDSKSLKSSGPKKIINQGNTIISEKNNFTNFSQQNNLQKPIQVHLNTSQPDKSVSTNRPYKPFQPRSMQDQNGQIPPSYSRSHREADKFKQILHRQQPVQTFTTYNIDSRFNGYAAKKPNEPSTSNWEPQKTQQKLKTANNQKSQANTSRQQQSQSFSVRRYPAQPSNFQNLNRNQSRTKTQQFYLLNTRNQTGYSPRFKTNFLPTTTTPQGNQKNDLQKSALSQSSIYAENKDKKIVNNPSVSPAKTKPAEGNDEAKNEEKKFQKIKQAQKIKEEMSFLGIENNNSKPLANDKSARDLLIKKKVEQKNKKHEDLKCAISKLLKQ